MRDKQATLEVHLQPGARNNEIVGSREGVLWVRVASPPLKDRANKALLELMAETLGVPKENLSIIRGRTSHHKVLAVHGLDSTELKEKLSRFSVRREKD